MVEDDVDKALGVIDTRGDVGGVNLLASKASTVNVLVGGNDDALGVSDLLGGQDVLGASGTLGLGLEGEAHLGGLLLEVLSSHVGVGDAGRAGGDGQNLGPVASVSSLGGSGGLGGLLLLAGSLGVVDDLQEGLGGLGSAKSVGKVGMHEHGGEVGEHLKMRVGLAVGSGNHEHEVCRRTIRSVPVNAAGDGHGSQTRLLDCSHLGMRDCDAVAHRGGELGLASEDALLIRGRVLDVARGVLQRHQLVDGIHLVGSCCANLDALNLEQISNLHLLLPFLRSLPNLRTPCYRQPRGTPRRLSPLYRSQAGFGPYLPASGQLTLTHLCHITRLQIASVRKLVGDDVRAVKVRKRDERDLRELARITENIRTNGLLERYLLYCRFTELRGGEASLQVRPVRAPKTNSEMVTPNEVNSLCTNKRFGDLLDFPAWEERATPLCQQFLRVGQRIGEIGGVGLGDGVNEALRGGTRVDEHEVAGANKCCRKSANRALLRHVELLATCKRSICDDELCLGDLDGTTSNATQPTLLVQAHEVSADGGL